MKKFLILFLIILVLSSCASSKKNHFYKHKYATESPRAHKQNQGLMLLKNTELGRNKYIHSNSYRQKLKQTKKRLRK